ncbi:hypothetical protein EYC84_010566 [Monilinia fructicola]|uniref:SGF29 C-terminal domain-containing protein n=1 Tax=Monilinia fructicola TaxID=38448 RepID=A0A5M9JC12_MONFR|nr:hypothetical protein EYC84_010566 [Monilinia fructicola]
MYKFFHPSHIFNFPPTAPTLTCVTSLHSEHLRSPLSALSPLCLITSTLLSSTLPYSTIPYSTIPYSTLFYSTLYSTLLYSTPLGIPTLYNPASPGVLLCPLITSIGITHLQLRLIFLPSTLIIILLTLIVPPAAGQNTHNQNKESKVSREVKHLEDSPGFNKNMSSTSTTNRRQARGGARSGTHERGEEAALWAEITQSLAKIRAEEKKFEADIPDGIISREIAIADQLNNGISPAIAAMDELSKYIRDGVKFSESTAAAIRQTVEKISILLALIKGNEAEREARIPANLMEDPVLRMMKMGNGRTSSLPPKGKDTPRKYDNGEAGTSSSSTSGTKKIEFSKGQEVAFKPKPEQNSPTETDWIQGKVTKVIGEGKSRRYKVEDVAPR